MSLDLSALRPDGGDLPPHVLPVRCTACNTDRDLTITAVTHPPEQPADVVMVSHTCSRCGHFSEHPAWVAELSIVLARLGQTDDVLILSGHYMHCGQPMERTHTELHRLAAPMSTEDTAEDDLEIYLPTRVLRCACGFQMELPE